MRLNLNLDLEYISSGLEPARVEAEFAPNLCPRKGPERSWKQFGNVMDAELMAELEKRIEKLGNVGQACREMGVSRSAYYKWKGSAKAPRRHPQAISASVRDQILKMAKDYPEWGCDRISYFLELRKEWVSATTVQKILKRNGLGKKSLRKGN
jgi:hypothetical protein